MDEIRAQFLSRGQAPRVTLKDAWRIKRLEYIFTADEEHAGQSCVITAWPEEGDRIAAWYQNLAEKLTGLHYDGQGLAGATHDALLRALKRERVWLTPEQKHEVLERCAYACAICKTRGDCLQMDHTVRLSQSFGPQEPDSFQSVCAACHAAKTINEPQSYEADVLASSVNPHVWGTYVKAARPPPLVHHFEDVPEDLNSLRIADVIRCRRRALEFSEHELPVFCVYDDWVARTEPELGDINFVTRPAGCFKELLGYTGPGPQHRVQTEFLMSQGVLGWHDISHTLTATGRLPRDTLREPFRILDEAWGDAEWGRKECFNALTGLFCLDEAWRFGLTTSSYSADAPNAVLRKTFRYPGGHVTDHITKQRLRSIATHRPLHDLCMCAEAAWIGRALAALRGSTVYEVKTDSILFSAAELEATTSFPRHYTGEPVFREGPVTPQDLMKSRGKMPQREAHAPVEPPAWRELTEEEAREHVLAGGSLAIEGVAGVGKSHFVGSLAKGLADVSAISKTHCASSRIGGVTADHFARSKILNGCFTSNTIWIDEVFQTECPLMTQIAKVPEKVQFLMAGDPHQFGPCFDSWRGRPVPPGAFERSSLYHSLARGCRLTLSRCRRSDQALFEYYSSLIRGGARFELPLPQVLEECRGLYRFEGPARHNVCISHRNRRNINAQLGATHKPPGAIYLRARNSQYEESMWIWPGCPLIGCSSSQRAKVRNNVSYVVEEVTESNVILEGGVRLSHPMVLALTRPGWCRTIASIQGDEFDDPLRIWDTRNPHFDMRSLYVCLSRARDASKVHVT